MWLGEQITERGIGNGMSLLIFAGIVVGLPRGIADSIQKVQTNAWGSLTIVAVVLLLVAWSRSWRSSSSWNARSGAFPFSARSALSDAA